MYVFKKKEKKGKKKKEKEKEEEKIASKAKEKGDKLKVECSQLIFGLDTKYSISSRKKFFEDYASTNGFDPLIPENWYSQSRQQILAFKVNKKKEERT